ncbi:hypothetical protein [Psychrobacillus psychrodurans]|uniref:hypothetical protein n=1 Tax=Psychrobacillus psychrodurans TaxID=126157 RepID=UPI003D092134
MLVLFSKNGGIFIIVFSELDTRLKPKQQWICDNCGEVIESIEDGCLEWYKGNDDSLVENFRIVHHDSTCMYDPQMLFKEGKQAISMLLESLVGDSGLVYLLGLGVTEIRNFTEYQEIIKRLHVDHYEEARLYWHLAEEDHFFEGANAAWPYLPETSLKIIHKYKEKGK